MFSYQKLLALAAAAVMVLVAGCGKHGTVSNGGVTVAVATGGQVGVASADKKSQTGSLTQLSIPMAYGHPSLSPQVSPIPRAQYASGAKPSPITAAMYQQFQRNPKAAAAFMEKYKQGNLGGPH